jgi:mono/diheme cytochrome c family protein
MIRPRMASLKRTALVLIAAIAATIAVAACGTERIHIPANDPNYKADYAGAELFNQRCGGCHTFSPAGTFGSGANPRTDEIINGPNFDQRCERPAIRVLYAIENGGFSGEYMPQNVVVGKQAREVAMFVSRFSGRQAPPEPGVATCQQQAIGTLPPLPSSLNQALAATTTTTPAATTTTASGTATVAATKTTTKKS